MAPPAALGAALGFLRCPHCAVELGLRDTVVRCRAGHAFDVARQGYVSLLTGRQRAGDGDTAGMLAARERFLEAHFRGLAERIAAEAAVILADGPPGCVVDVGAGSGWHLARVLERLPDRAGIALDVSRYALRRAARVHPRVAAVGCDVWQGLPVGDEAAALALNVFAPRNGPEIARVLHPGGALIVVTPTARHLTELGSALAPVGIDARKEERVERALGPGLVHTSETIHEQELALGRDEVRDLVAMGPSARHHDPGSLQSLVDELPEPFAVSASVRVSVHRPA